MSVMVSYAMADAAKDRIVCKATGWAGYMSALHWWSSKSTYTQTVVLVSNKSKGNKKCLRIIIRVIIVLLLLIKVIVVLLLPLVLVVM